MFPGEASSILLLDMSGDLGTWGFQRLRLPGPQVVASSVALGNKMPFRCPRGLQLMTRPEERKDLQPLMEEKPVFSPPALHRPSESCGEAASALHSSLPFQTPCGSCAS